jgi:plasmid stabilization system protein ParE
MTGVGAYFLDSFFSEIDSLILFGGMHRQMFGFHRMLARRFPYAIYHQLKNPQTIVVWRVLDLREHPGKLRTELE